VFQRTARPIDDASSEGGDAEAFLTSNELSSRGPGQATVDAKAVTASSPFDLAIPRRQMTKRVDARELGGAEAVFTKAATRCQCGCHSGAR